jgi:ABC-type Fe3+-siderophore transport system permease subunit
LTDVDTKQGRANTLALFLGLVLILIALGTVFLVMTNELGLTRADISPIKQSVLWDLRLTDIAARVVAEQQTIPIGVVTTLVRVPFFAVILYRARPQT